MGEASHPGPHRLASSSEDEFLVHEELLDSLQQDLLPGSGEFGGGSETMTVRMPSFGANQRATNQTFSVCFIHASGPCAANSARQCRSSPSSQAESPQ